MRKLLFTLHLYTALVAGLFIVILGVTGAIMAFEPELDHLFHAKLAYVTPQSHALSLAGISDAISRVFPGERISGYALSTSPNLSYQVSLARGLIYVNQYTGNILGPAPRAWTSWVSFTSCTSACSSGVPQIPEKRS